MSSWSSTNIWKPTPSCLIWDVHCIRQALAFAAASAGSKIAAKMAIIAMTTNNSISVNAPRWAAKVEDFGTANDRLVLRTAFMDLHSSVCQDDGHALFNCKLLRHRRSETIPHLRLATNVLIH